MYHEKDFNCESLAYTLMSANVQELIRSGWYFAGVRQSNQPFYCPGMLPVDVKIKDVPVKGNRYGDEIILFRDV
jgi:hypothetical protein